MIFRDKLIGTLRLLRDVLEEPGVLVVGSEVPNLLEPDAASTLVVSQDVDLGVPVNRVESIKRRLRQIEGLVPSADEPSVYVPTSPALIEANFLGLDRRIREPSETYVFDGREAVDGSDGRKGGADLLMEPQRGMPDPTPFRHQITRLLSRIEERHG